ncbi:chorismate-binding protein, partial [Bacteroidota bacterium]
LCEKYPTAFKYFLYHPEIGFWMGASPEQLVNLDNNKIEIVALAGTQKNYNQGIINVRWNEKEIEEQEIVSKFIYNCLINNDLQNITFDNAETAQAGNLFHLKTIFNATLNKNFKLDSLLNDLHPTPAVCGLPKEKSRKIINELESHNREYYCGFFGPVNHRNNINLFVNLRCMKIIDNKAILFVGGGITKDSIPEDEWQETVEKSKTLSSVIF